MNKYMSMSIKEAMNRIEEKKFLLPAIQRKFIWSREQIENLFDSLIRGYPINSFMIWNIDRNSINSDYVFYEFISDYVQKFNENNKKASIENLRNGFDAIIDGQQRLTSIYIGLSGSYKVKKTNKRWMDNEHNTPMERTELYLEITKPLPIDAENKKLYNFRFLSKDQLKNEEKKFSCWFKVGDISKPKAKIDEFLRNKRMISNKFARKTLYRLYEVIHDKSVINFCYIKEKDQEAVLDMFIRANSGGTPLSLSDLLMSISSAYWHNLKPKNEIDELRKEIGSYGNPKFNVSQDFVLKALLVLSDSDVAFKINNFNKKNIKKFEELWEDIRESLTTTFKLLDQLNYNDDMLRAKNAAIPIAYYIYKNNLANKIYKSTYKKRDKQEISRWLSRSLLNGIFGGTSDTILSQMRNVIKNSKSKTFPVNEIINKINSSSGKSYFIDDNRIDEFLNSQYGTSRCDIVLNLLYSDVVLNSPGGVAQDHMHPRSIFEKKRNSVLSTLNLSQSKLNFFKDKNNYNSCLNLQLLDKTENESKNNLSLQEWAKKQRKKSKDLKIKPDTSLNIRDFEGFINDRRKVLKKELKKILIG